MKTLIELYDDRPIENVLASEVFMPEKTVFLCPPEVAQNKLLKMKLKEYFSYRKLKTEPIFLESSMYNADKLLAQLTKVTKTYSDCVVDLTGGTEAALFACGMLTKSCGTPAFTYSRRKQKFFNISGAPFAENLPCTLEHSVEDCFRMAGGALRKGRVDNAILGRYSDKIEPYFKLYMKHRVGWTKAVSFIQQVSQGQKDKKPSLYVKSSYTVKTGRGSRTDAPEEILRDYASLGFIKKLKIKRGGSVSFEFADQQVRTWMRDVGSVLELYVWKLCLDSGLFGDVVTSAVVDWEGSFSGDSVTNEIDVMTMRGVMPFFISCKTCAVSTEAINELAILRDRFGGKGAKAAIVTAERCRSITRHRASELQIKVIDLDDIKSGKAGDRIRAHAEEE